MIPLLYITLLARNIEALHFGWRSFYRRRLSPEVHPLRFYMPFWRKKVLILYTKFRTLHRFRGRVVTTSHLPSPFFFLFLSRIGIFVFWLFSHIKFCFISLGKTLNGSQETLLGSFLSSPISLAPPAPCSPGLPPPVPPLHNYFISPCQTQFWSMSFSAGTKQELPQNWHELRFANRLGTRCPLLWQSTRSRSCTRERASCPNVNVGMDSKMMMIIIIIIIIIIILIIIIIICIWNL